MDLAKKYFIQHMFRHGQVTKSNALKFYEKILDDGPQSIESLNEAIKTINKHINGQHFKLVWTTCEVTGREVLVLINSYRDQITESQTQQDPLQQEYFNVLLRNIVDSEDHCLPFTSCLNAVEDLHKTMSKESAQNYLHVWIRSGIFVEKDGNIFLGQITIIEYASLLREILPDAFCKFCSEITLIGKTCRNCDALFHSHCLERFLKQLKICPECKLSWQDND